MSRNHFQLFYNFFWWGGLPLSMCHPGTCLVCLYMGNLALHIIMQLVLCISILVTNTLCKTIGMFTNICWIASNSHVQALVSLSFFLFGACFSCIICSFTVQLLRNIFGIFLDLLLPYKYLYFFHIQSFQSNSTIFCAFSQWSLSWKKHIHCCPLVNGQCC